MKTISKKQFENAVKMALNGGKSSIVTTREIKPYYWTRSKGHMRLQGEAPENSKFLRNDARGGKASDVYLVAELNANYTIKPTKQELKKAEQEKKKAETIEEKKKLEKKKQNAEISIRLKKIAVEMGFKSISELKKHNDENIQLNENRRVRALINRKLKFKELNNEPYDASKISHRVAISRIELEFDCESKKCFFVSKGEIRWNK
jgi:hypothetical protein